MLVWVLQVFVCFVFDVLRDVVWIARLCCLCLCVFVRFSCMCLCVLFVLYCELVFGSRVSWIGCLCVCCDVMNVFVFCVWLNCVVLYGVLCVLCVCACVGLCAFVWCIV